MEGNEWIHIIEIPEDFHVMLVRILVALVLSGLVGLEREVSKRPAGFRTHILVGMGACMMMLLSLYGFEEFIENYDNVQYDPARIPSYVISGIGFLGAGTILVKGATIRGLTTAASIWVVAGLGLTVGAGLYTLAILSTVVVLLSLMFLNRLETLLFKHGAEEIIHIVVPKDGQHLAELLRIIEDYGKIRNVRTKDLVAGDGKERLKEYKFTVLFAESEGRIKVLDALSIVEVVKEVY
ncbi:MgtC/SapB family protein [Aureibacillus halotolerans]|uniref:Putative Mg2+ transporter-C (MgtC) family protein n=1 Tax=Aureibacillus halotolerans TaxID=1508390 RepID=A0A4R6TQ94_9BACI|nr:MgtC/SapB family protein [Aureibacillus halotolerans]TDQ34677.1 putative Mg2+ transporter-C (MgtC) family protein [Aureibacillus halotolerans]